LNQLFFGYAQKIKNLEKPPEGTDWRELLEPWEALPKAIIVKVGIGGEKSEWKPRRGREWKQVTERLKSNPATTMVLLNGKEWTGQEEVKDGDTIPVLEISLKASGPA
jgi:hypothetical protein